MIDSLLNEIVGEIERLGLAVRGVQLRVSPTGTISARTSTDCCFYGATTEEALRLLLQHLRGRR